MNVKMCDRRMAGKDTDARAELVVTTTDAPSESLRRELREESDFAPEQRGERRYAGYR